MHWLVGALFGRATSYTPEDWYGLKVGLPSSQRTVVQACSYSRGTVSRDHKTGKGLALLFFIHLFVFYMYGCFSYMYVMHPVHTVPMKVRRGC